ncbi:unnamed protein product [Mesocestoides corti]|uniref:RNA-binding motif protein, X-linked 2 n=1 Tax=Mesocestoides corti TaxID=53468 RepID=A0A0R3UH28_MESCO|nr:unnamed protein product [Mesocestoides corti]
MNPITQTKNQNAMNERELRLGYTGTESSWHRQYKDSAWIFVGGLNYDLTEGDVICVFSQYGEIANINLVRDKDTGRSKGFAFVCYENQKSTVLATDNLNGIKLAGRIIRVDHVEKYKVPATGVVRVGREDANQAATGVGDGEAPWLTDFVREHGCGPEAMRKIAEIQKARAAKSQQQSAGKSSSPHRLDKNNGLGHNDSPSPPRRATRDRCQSPQGRGKAAHSQRKMLPTPRKRFSPPVGPSRHERMPSPHTKRRHVTPPNYPPSQKPQKHNSPSHRRFISPTSEVDVSPRRRLSPSPPRRQRAPPVSNVSPPRRGRPHQVSPSPPRQRRPPRASHSPSKHQRVRSRSVSVTGRSASPSAASPSLPRRGRLHQASPSPRHRQPSPASCSPPRRQRVRSRSLSSPRR